MEGFQGGTGDATRVCSALLLERCSGHQRCGGGSRGSLLTLLF